MLFIDFKDGCSPQELSVMETSMPVLKPGQVLVKVAAFGINRADTLQRQGKYPAPAGESPILGLEMAGEVIEVSSSAEIGAGNDIWQPSDQVFGLVAGGAYAQYVAVDACHLMRVPKNITMIEAAGLAEVFLTAFQSMFEVADLQAKQKILIHAGASGVGLAAIQLAKVKGCMVAVTASNDLKLQKCAELGADLLVNYKQQDFVERIKKSWQGCDLIIDFVAGDYLNRNLQVLNIDGSIVNLAMLSGRFVKQLDMGLVLGKRARIMGSTLRSRSDNYKQNLIAAFKQQFMQLFDTAELLPSIDTVYAANEVSIAHQRIEDNDTMGKLICRW
ncbi:MAG: NADPH2:quinone reductase [Paraglaciecola sp.]|jgi:NADPH2:quinone reductase